MEEQAMSNEERIKLVAQISNAFSPSAPINKRDLFAGRIQQIDTAIGAVFQRGQHAIIFGERGVGKTSLATTLFDILQGLGFQSLESGTINCDLSMDFSSLWHKIFRDMSINISSRGAGFTNTGMDNKISLDLELPEKVTPDDVRQMLNKLPDQSIIIIDEVDRLKQDDDTTTLLADTIKTLSDHSVNATLILVGVADSVSELIAEHNSVERALLQIHMPRMTKEEILETLNIALSKTDLTMTENAKELISKLSKGLPHYAHSLGLNSARIVVRNHRTHITKEDVKISIKQLLTNAQESISKSYHKAVSGQKGNLYPQVLLACALAPTDFLGYFSAADAREPLSKIMKKRYEIPAFAPHLHTFCSEGRGQILQKIETSNRNRFRFANPLIQPFVIMRGIDEGLIDETALENI